jgi:hypothetical protein
VALTQTLALEHRRSAGILRAASALCAGLMLLAALATLAGPEAGGAPEPTAASTGWPPLMSHGYLLYVSLGGGEGGIPSVRASRRDQPETIGAGRTFIEVGIEFEPRAPSRMRLVLVLAPAVPAGAIAWRASLRVPALRMGLVCIDARQGPAGGPVRSTRPAVAGAATGDE